MIKKGEFLKQCKLHCKLNMSKEQWAEVYDTFCMVYKDYIIHAEDVVLHGVGTFVTKVFPARTSRDPRNGNAIKIPARLHLRFTPIAALKRTLKSLVITEEKDA